MHTVHVRCPSSSPHLKEKASFNTMLWGCSEQFRSQKSPCSAYGFHCTQVKPNIRQHSNPPSNYTELLSALVSSCCNSSEKRGKWCFNLSACTFSPWHECPSYSFFLLSAKKYIQPSLTTPSHHNQREKSMLFIYAR